MADERLTIAEIEALLNKESSWDDCTIRILPNGEIRRVEGAESDVPTDIKPLTYRENLGGEYA